MNDTIRWYEPNPESDSDARDRAAQLISETSAIESRQSQWYELNLLNATLYTNREPSAFRWGEPQDDQELWPSNLRTENVIKEIGEAMCSKASSSPLKPGLQPHGDDYEVETAVRLVDDFVFAVWRCTQSEEAAVMMYRDAFISGLGCVRVGYEDGRLEVESVFFDNVVIDNRECGSRQKPRTYRIRRVLPRASVEARWGVSFEDAATRKQYIDSRELSEGWVVVVEAWRLPDDDGKGGRHSVASCGQMLEDAPWKHDWVPLVFFHWEDRTNGFFVPSGVEDLVPYQVRLNELNEVISLSMDLACRPRILQNANSMIDTSQWDNEVGRILMYAGEKPTSFEWKTNIEPLLGERERTRAQAFSHVGMSEAFANADIPNQVRMDSSAGVREFRNMEDSRHLRRWTRFENARLEIAKTCMRVLSVSKGADAFSAVYHPGGNKASTDISYETISAIRDLIDNQYSWQMVATPLSAMAPAARRELLRDFSARGLITPGSAEARRMEGHPNLDRIEDLELASEEDVYRHLSILEKGDYEAPTELTNLTYGIARVTQNYHRLKKKKNVKARVFQNHIKWIVAATSIQQRAVPPAPTEMTPFAPTQGMPGTSSATAGI